MLLLVVAITTTAVVCLICCFFFCVKQCCECYAHDTLAGNSRWFQRLFPARVATKFALVFNEKTWQTTKMLLLNSINTIYYYKNNDVYNIYLQTSRSTKLTNHIAPFTPDSSVE